MVCSGSILDLEEHMRRPSQLLPRALALSWAGFWLFFFAVESAVWHTPVLTTLPWVGLGLLFVVSALLPCRWDAIGGSLLIAFGLSAGVAYALWSPSGLPVASRILTIVALSGPPAVAGVLFIVNRRAAMPG